MTEDSTRAVDTPGDLARRPSRAQAALRVFGVLGRSGLTREGEIGGLGKPLFLVGLMAGTQALGRKLSPSKGSHGRGRTAPKVTV